MRSKQPQVLSTRHCEYEADEQRMRTHGIADRQSCRSSHIPCWHWPHGPVFQACRNSVWPESEHEGLNLLERTLFTFVIQLICQQALDRLVHCVVISMLAMGACTSRVPLRSLGPER